MNTYKEKLSNCVGWKGFKSFVHNLEIERDYEKPYRLFTFVGNPGTGKTTAARLLGDVMFELGLIKTNKVVECHLPDFMSSYVGQTAIKTNHLVDSALGGILSIDDIHDFMRDDGFVKEALDTLQQRIINDRDGLTVILSGYKHETDTFLSVNPGIKHRNANYIEFEDFAPEELAQIIIQCTKTFCISPEVNKAIMDFIAATWPTRGKYFRNARWAEEFASKIIHCALRRDDVVINDEKQLVITIDDVSKAIEEMR